MNSLSHRMVFRILPRYGNCLGRNLQSMNLRIRAFRSQSYRQATAAGPEIKGGRRVGSVGASGRFRELAEKGPTAFRQQFGFRTGDQDMRVDLDFDTAKRG